MNVFVAELVCFELLFHIACQDFPFFIGYDVNLLDVLLFETLCLKIMVEGMIHFVF